MKVQLMLAQDEGSDQVLTFEMPGVPRAGDCVMISRPGQAGSTNFVVRRIRWALDHPGADPCHRVGESIVGATNAVTVECDFAVGPYSAEEHKWAAAGGAG